MLERKNIRALLIDDEHDAFVMTRALLKQIERPTIELHWVATFSSSTTFSEIGRASIFSERRDATSSRPRRSC